VAGAADDKKAHGFSSFGVPVFGYSGNPLCWMLGRPLPIGSAAVLFFPAGRQGLCGG
jgi:hypothetical protein